jgi:multidrug transporter EmrE-like cation transporter
MIYLFLCILANVGIFLCFRLFKTFGLDTFQAIVFNYITCVATGIIFQGSGTFIHSFSLSYTWVQIGAVLGGIFIGTFYLMALTTQKLSMTVSSIASKMSLIIPVLVSLLILNIQSKDYSVLNFVGMFTALLAIILSSYKKKNNHTTGVSPTAFLLPLAVFIFGGIIDSSINYTNFKYLTPESEPIFPIIIFSSATIIGIITLIIRNGKLKFKNALGGIALGAINYFSIYFLIKSLSSFNNDGALVYPLLNVGIILIASGVSVVFFREKLSRLNIAGLSLAIFSIIFISYQELLLILK